jgi:hypothetical protein
MGGHGSSGKAPACKHEDPSLNSSIAKIHLKKNKNKKAGNISQVVQYLPSMHKGLGSFPGTTKKKKVMPSNSMPRYILKKN